MDKFKLNTNKEKLSDSEIEQQMNFDKFISAHAPAASTASKLLGSKKWFAKGAKLYTVIAASVVVVVSTIIYSNQKTNADKVVEAPFIIPPVAALDIPKDAFEITTETDTTIICKNGSFIDVPANAFVDEKGNDVKGKIQMRYREFHDQIDIILSGIPMNYDSAGNHYQLESAGMFEILAFQNNEAIHLKPGKQVNVSLISQTNNTEDYNIYYLDTVKKEWIYKSENTAQNKTCFPLFYEKPAIAKKTNTSTTKEFGTITKPVLPKKASSSKFNFSIDYKKEEFPELAAYNGLKFEPVKKNEKQYEALSKKTWEDVFIEKSASNYEQYTVTFSTENESHSFNVFPVVDEKDYAATMKDFENKQKQYQALLAKKRKMINEKTDSLYVINEAYKEMAIKSNLNERLNNFIDDRFTETSRDLLAYRTFPLAFLGIWNCDKPINIFAENSKYTEMNKTYDASFTTSDGAHLPIKQVYLIRRGVNSVGSILKANFNKFPYTQKGMDIMVGITYENKIMYIKDEELNKIEPEGKNVVFKMNSVGDDVLSSTQLKNFLKF